MKGRQSTSLRCKGWSLEIGLDPIGDLSEATGLVVHRGQVPLHLISEPNIFNKLRSEKLFIIVTAQRPVADEWAKGSVSTKINNSTPKLSPGHNTRHAEAAITPCLRLEPHLSLLILPTAERRE